MRLLEVICEELGVEVGETWKGNDGNKYKILNSGTIVKDDNGWGFTRLETYEDLLIGELRPVWKPKIGETYYTPYINALSHSEVYIPETWGEDIWYDEVMQARGLIFRTKQEAINCANEMIALAKQGI